MLFHPFEIAFCGYSGSGKTTLVAALVRSLTEKYTIAYYKHGCHRFDIDREGKDSWILRQAGAGTVMIDDPEKQAIITDHRSGTGRLEHQAFIDSDLLFVEGLKELPVQKLILVDSDHRILELIRNGTLKSVAALIVPDDPGYYAEFGMPVYRRDSIHEIAGFIETLLLERSSKDVPLFGLVLAGGRSSRMGSDKALIEYHTANQLEHTAALLQKRCSNVFVSCRREQADTYAPFGIPLITDRYLEIGPMGGLLSAWQTNPGAAWVIAACDMPFLDAETVRQLCEHRNRLRFATVFRNPESKGIEPLFACYEPKSRTRLFERHLEGNNSLASFLKESRIEELTPPGGFVLQNINDAEGRQAQPTR